MRRHVLIPTNLIENIIVGLGRIPGENGDKIKILTDRLRLRQKIKNKNKNQGLIILKTVANVLNGNNEVRLIDNCVTD